MVLSGAKYTGTDYTATNLLAINSNLRGTVGNILVQNLNQQLSRAAATFPTNAATSVGGVFAATAGTLTTTPYANVQGSANGLAAASALVVGDQDSNLGNGNSAGADTLFVIRL